MWTTCPNKNRVDCTKMVVQLLVKLVARWVGLEGAYKGKKVSSRVSYGLSDRGITVLHVKGYWVPNHADLHLLLKARARFRPCKVS